MDGVLSCLLRTLLNGNLSFCQLDINHCGNFSVVLWIIRGIVRDLNRFSVEWEELRLFKINENENVSKLFFKRDYANFIM
jgi:hypothetical protein